MRRPLVRRSNYWRLRGRENDVVRVRSWPYLLHRRQARQSVQSAGPPDQLFQHSCHIHWRQHGNRGGTPPRPHGPVEPNRHDTGREAACGVRKWLAPMGCRDDFPSGLTLTWRCTPTPRCWREQSTDECSKPQTVGPRQPIPATGGQPIAPFNRSAVAPPASDFDQVEISAGAVDQRPFVFGSCPTKDQNN